MKIGDILKPSMNNAESVFEPNNRYKITSYCMGRTEVLNLQTSEYEYIDDDDIDYYYEIEK